jgi:hypothetical protein
MSRLSRLSLIALLLAVATSSTFAAVPTTNLVLWLKPESLSSLYSTNGTPVTYWQDSSGLNNNAVDSTGWGTPVYQTPANGINGFAGVKFGASNVDAMWIANGQTSTITGTGLLTPINLGSTGLTYVFVFKLDPADPNTNLPPLSNYNLALGDEVDATRFGLKNNLATIERYDNAISSSYVSLLGTTPLNNTSPYPGHYIIATHQNDTGNFNDLANLYADNLAEAGPTTIPYNGATQVSRIGQHAGGGGYGFNGTITEVLVYSSALSTDDRLALQTYLADRYSIPEPASLALLAAGGVLVMGRKRMR